MSVLFKKIKYLDEAAQSLIEGELLVADGRIADLGLRWGGRMGRR